MDKVRLNNGICMPMIGFGIWDIRGKDCIECVKNAISCGYRMIDTVICMTIKSKVMSMIQEKQLKDDNGRLFGFGTHMFRHYYGVKLTEMHLDDWTIARLLGHKRVSSVKHYRKMSNQQMADETREVRQMMSDIIYKSLAGWGEEYEQIRQDD